MIIIPGYCVAGTVGHKVLAGQKKIEIENKQIVIVEKIIKTIKSKEHFFTFLIARSQTICRIHVFQRSC